MTNYRNYDRFPRKAIDCKAGEVFGGWADILTALRACCAGRGKSVVVLECYPGADLDELRRALSGWPDARLFCAEDCAFAPDSLDAAFAPNMTDDRVFGKMTTALLSDYFLPDKLAAMRAEAAAAPEPVSVVYGTGAALVTRGDVLVYCDLARWEIQLRYRRGMGNWRCDNGGAPQLTKYKRGFFLEWRLADRLKKELLGSLDWIIDTNTPDAPSMISGDLFRRAMDRFSSEPFRTVPYFDPGPWGGQWMKEVCGLDPDEKNFAWSFDGVPEENSLLLDCGGRLVQLPAMDLILSRPAALLGDKVYGRYGAEFPIRFDFLDTMGGGNLSLQVHPLTEYIQNTFGMHYTQDESYYFLDCGEDACVYLGLKEGVDPQEMLDALRASEETGEFDAEKYVNKFPVQKHDHVLIPAGTVHCSGANGMVLEVSATPYIFTFKLYDWGRLGMDGRPRPIHIGHGEKVIQWDRDTEWVEQNLLHQTRVLEESEHCRAEQTGLHALEPIRTTRYWFDQPISLETEGGVNVLNLVEGGEALVESPDGAFAPFPVHYAETFIVPAAAGRYTIRPAGVSAGRTIGVLRAEIKA